MSELDLLLQYMEQHKVKGAYCYVKLFDDGSGYIYQVPSHSWGTDEQRTLASWTTREQLHEILRPAAG